MVIVSTINVVSDNNFNLGQREFWSISRKFSFLGFSGDELAFQ
jgi:hypothetical protein